MSSCEKIVHSGMTECEKNILSQLLKTLGEQSDAAIRENGIGNLYGVRVCLANIESLVKDSREWASKIRP